jgi:hypothetical protein
MGNIELVIKRDEAGVREIVVRTLRGERADGIKLVERLLPTLADELALSTARAGEPSRG